ncbi:MAG: peptidoglycan DD-metalloendopeptidase family protein [Saprospiraceae bacterium]|nr:peptidoglycan DD-metalloendopeptidase family protein [Saprospiraceae bacterium]
MKKSINQFYLLFFLLCFSVPGWNQSRQDLEKQRTALLKEIEKTSKALESTRKSRQKNLAQLRVLEQQMTSRRKLLETLESEIQMNEKVLLENEATLSSLEAKYAMLKEQFANMVRTGYIKKMSNSKWIYLLSSASLNQLMIRWRYMSQLEQFTTQKLSQIKAMKGEILVRNEAISKTREQNLAALEESAKNIEKLQQEQKEKDELIKKLGLEEDKLQKKLKKSEKEKANLNAAIEKIILAELAKVSKSSSGEAAAESGKKTTAGSSSFSKLQGVLPKPVANAKITSRFGTHPHPTVPNIQVSNSGVDFTLNSLQDVICVHEGEVVGLIFMPGFKNVVIVRHENYSTVYAKLDEVSVKKGQKVSRGKVLGRAGQDEEGKREFHFELWKDKTKLDPQKWFE